MSEATAPARRRLGPPFTAPEGQGATFVELFFDLVFVFALTEVTALTLKHLDWEGATRSLLDLLDDLVGMGSMDVGAESSRFRAWAGGARDAGRNGRRVHHGGVGGPGVHR